MRAKAETIIKSGKRVSYTIVATSPTEVEATVITQDGTKSHMFANDNTAWNWVGSVIKQLDENYDYEE